MEISYWLYYAFMYLLWLLLFSGSSYRNCKPIHRGQAHTHTHTHTHKHTLNMKAKGHLLWMLHISRSNQILLVCFDPVASSVGQVTIQNIIHYILLVTVI